MEKLGKMDEKKYNFVGKITVIVHLYRVLRRFNAFSFTILEDSGFHFCKLNANKSTLVHESKDNQRIRGHD